MTPPRDPYGDCAVCGGPTLQNGNDHAPWCERTAAYLASEEGRQRHVLCAYDGCNIIVEWSGDRCDRHTLRVASEGVKGAVA